MALGFDWGFRKTRCASAHSNLSAPTHYTTGRNAPRAHSVVGSQGYAAQGGATLGRYQYCCRNREVAIAGGVRQLEQLVSGGEKQRDRVALLDARQTDVLAAGRIRSFPGVALQRKFLQALGRVRDVYARVAV